jgi:hypothetical protein
MGASWVTMIFHSVLFAADIIVTSGDLENDFDLAVSPESIKFVMKGSRIFKRDGSEYTVGSVTCNGGENRPPY